LNGKAGASFVCHQCSGCQVAYGYLRHTWSVSWFSSLHLGSGRKKNDLNRVIEEVINLLISLQKYIIR